MLLRTSTYGKVNNRTQVVMFCAHRRVSQHVLSKVHQYNEKILNLRRDITQIQKDLEDKKKSIIMYEDQIEEMYFAISRLKAKLQDVDCDHVYDKIQ